MQNLRISLLQMDLVWESPADNRTRAAELIQQVPPGTQVILLPEMFTTGFSMEAARLAEPFGGPSTEWMEQTAKRTGALIAGSVITSEGGKYYNRFIAAEPGGKLHVYDKRHLFRMAGEHNYYTAGNTRLVFEWQGWRICPQVCYDLRFPAWSRNSLRSGAGYDLLLYVANWPMPRISHWNSLLVARAIENQCYTAGVNRTGTDGNNIVYSGDSRIVDYLGNVMTTAAGQEAVLSAELDAEALRAYREKFPAWQDADDYTIL